MAEKPREDSRASSGIAKRPVSSLAKSMASLGTANAERTSGLKSSKHMIGKKLTPISEATKSLQENASPQKDETKENTATAEPVSPPPPKEAEWNQTFLDVSKWISFYVLTDCPIEFLSIYWQIRSIILFFDLI